MTEHELIFQEYLARKGLKLTAPRRQILDAVFSLHEHFDAEHLYACVKKEADGVSLATVYRTLPLLMEAGLIQLSLRSSSRDVFEHIYGHPRHIHWVCAACGQVWETALDPLNPFLASEAGQLKFRVAEADVRVRGLCWKCQSTENEKQ